MNRFLLPVLGVLLILAVVAFGRSGSTQRDTRAQTENVQEAADRVRIDELRANPSVAGPNASADAETPPAPKAKPRSDSNLPSNPTIENTPDERKHLLFSKTYHVAKRLGWNVISDDAAFLAKWQTTKRNEERELKKRIRGLGSRDEMREFNQKTDARRNQLIAKFGLGVARTVLAAFPLYQFSLPEGRWHRIDASGRETPFQHRDENIFIDGDWIR